MRPRRLHRLRASRERGETLLELIVAIMILGVCVVAIGTGLALTVTMSALHRSQATAQDSLHNYAETLQSHYHSCTTSPAPPAFYAQTLAQLVPPGFSPPTVAVQYWAPTGGAGGTGAFVAECPSTDAGLQQVELTIASTSNRVSESLVVALRNLS